MPIEWHALWVIANVCIVTSHCRTCLSDFIFITIVNKEVEKVLNKSRNLNVFIKAKNTWQQSRKPFIYKVPLICSKFVYMFQVSADTGGHESQLFGKTFSSSSPSGSANTFLLSHERSGKPSMFSVVLQWILAVGTCKTSVFYQHMPAARLNVQAMKKLSQKLKRQRQI